MIKDIKKINIKDKKIILRVDFNLTFDVNGKIIDDIRMRYALPTIKYLIEKKAKKIIIVSHLGRPIIRPNANIDQIIKGNQNLTLLKIAKNLAKLLNIRSKILYKKFNDFNLPYYQINDQIIMLENIRFVKEEEQNDLNFAKKLAQMGDLYINDAFGASHRSHASVVAITKYIPSYAGFLMQKEIDNLSQLITKPEKPFILILGGAKVTEKIKVLKKLLRKSSKILLGGVMANTFLASKNINLKNSKIDYKSISLAKEIYHASPNKFYLPTDLIWRNDIAVDIGKTTIEQYRKIIDKGKTVFWNGTMGLTSMGNFKYSLGTRSIIESIAENKSANKIVCGGDTIAEVSKINMEDKFNYISTGGGAALEFLSGKKLPAIEALEKSYNVNCEM